MKDVLRRWRRPRYEAAIYGIRSGVRYPYPFQRFHTRGEAEDFIGRMNSTHPHLTRWELIER